MSPVIVLHAPLPGHAAPDAGAALLAALPYAKRLALERAEPVARSASLAGIALALAALRRLRGADVGPGELRFPQDGKPQLPGGPAFSISHAADRVGCAARIGPELGFDLETLVWEADRTRLRHWTAVEATLKAAGLGLRETSGVTVDRDLRMATLRGVRYTLHEIDLQAPAVAHLASEERIAALVVEPVPLAAVLEAAVAR